MGFFKHPCLGLCGRVVFLLLLSLVCPLILTCHAGGRDLQRLCRAHFSLSPLGGGSTSTIAPFNLQGLAWGAPRRWGATGCVCVCVVKNPWKGCSHREASSNSDARVRHPFSSMERHFQTSESPANSTTCSPSPSCSG